MRTTIILVFSVALTGCESEFDKCINAELALTSEALGIDRLKTNLEELQSIRGEILQDVRDAPLLSDYFELNPVPRPKFSMEDFPTVEAYIAADREFQDNDVEYKRWDDLRKEFLLGLARSNGLSEDVTYDEFVEANSKMYSRFHELMKPRTDKNNCWGSSYCISPRREERRSQGIEKVTAQNVEKALEIEERAIAEAMLMLANEIGATERSATQISTITCNNMGLHE